MIAAVGASRASTFAAVPVTCLALSDYSKASFRTSCRLQLAASTASPGGVFDQPAATSMTLMGWTVLVDAKQDVGRVHIQVNDPTSWRTCLGPHNSFPWKPRGILSLSRAERRRSRARSKEFHLMAAQSPFGRRTRISAKRIPSELTCLRHAPTREAECVHIDESILLRGVWPVA
jgi:hypothetical protein